MSENQILNTIKNILSNNKNLQPFSTFNFYQPIKFYEARHLEYIIVLIEQVIPKLFSQITNSEKQDNWKNYFTRVIHIRRSVSKNKVTTPKTQKSIRSVPILDDLVPYLKRLPKNRSVFLFSKQDGTITSGSESINRDEYNALLKRCDIKYRKIYATRHTFIVSMLKYSNLSILEVAQIVGHTTTQMIVQNYGKYIKGEHLRIDRNLKLFTDKSTDRLA